MSGLPDRFEQARKAFPNSNGPQLSIYTSGGGHISAAAVRELFDKPPTALYVGADPEANEIGFVPTDGDDPQAYTFSSDDDGVGGDVRFGTALDTLGIDTETFDETQYVPLERTDGVVVADMSELVNDDGSDDGSDDGNEIPAANEVSIPSSVDPDAPANTEGDNSDGVGQADETAAEDGDDGPDDLGIEDISGTIVDGDGSVTAKLQDLFEIIVDGEPIETTCSEVGDAIDVDGRKVVHYLKDLDGYAVTRTDDTDVNGASIWRIERQAAAIEQDGTDNTNHTDNTDDTDGTDDDRDGAIDWADALSKDDVEYHCGYCGKGPWDRRGRVSGHHERMGHPGEVILRTTEPADGTTLDSEVSPVVDSGEPRERVRDWLDRHTPAYRYFRTEDIAIECDLAGNKTGDILDSGVEGYDIERGDGLWRIDPADGGAA